MVNIQDNGHTVNDDPYYVQKIKVNGNDLSDVVIMVPLVVADGYAELSITEKQDFVFDFDANLPVSWTVGGSDADQFDIDSGVLSFKEPPYF